MQHLLKQPIRMLVPLGVVEKSGETYSIGGASIRGGGGGLYRKSANNPPRKDSANDPIEEEEVGVCARRLYGYW